MRGGTGDILCWHTVGQTVGVHARAIVLAGPSGAGKSRLAERLGLPVLRLDDFYKSGEDHTLPRIQGGANAGLIDWDDPASWHLQAALDAVEALCHAGVAEVPVYSIPHNASIGTRTLRLEGHRLFVAEGIFAAEVVPSCRDQDLLAAAFCVRQHPVLTFWRRLTRDLREHRKPPLVLLRRGTALLRDQRRVVEHAVSRGCRPVRPDEAFDEVSQMVVGTQLEPR